MTELSLIKYFVFHIPAPRFWANVEDPCMTTSSH